MTLSACGDMVDTELIFSLHPLRCRVQRGGGGGLTQRVTSSRMGLVWAAEMQKRTLDSMMGVAGKPTTTTPMFLFNISLPKALAGPTRGEAGSEAASSTITKPGALAGLTVGASADTRNKTTGPSPRALRAYPILAGM